MSTWQTSTTGRTGLTLTTILPPLLPPSMLADLAATTLSPQLTPPSSPLPKTLNSSLSFSSVSERPTKTTPLLTSQSLTTMKNLEFTRVPPLLLLTSEVLVSPPTNSRFSPTLSALSPQGESTCLAFQGGYCALANFCDYYIDKGLWDYDFKLQFDS